mgnify:FL=1
MKKRNVRLLVVGMALIAIVAGQFVVRANGIIEESEETLTTSEQLTEEEQTSENIMESDYGNASQQTEMNSTEDSELPTPSEKETQNDLDNDMNNELEEKNTDMESVISESIYNYGLKYYLNRYLYDRETKYLQTYLEYLELEVAAGKEMYEVGDITEADVKMYQAQKEMIEAQIQAANNQISYNDLFLNKNHLDYSDYVVKEEKDMKEIDYYMERYTGKNYMTIAGDVTTYNNALAYIKAKKVEIEALNMKMDSAKLLYSNGEISRVEMKQQETGLAKAQYELEQYYVEMNQAYINLITYCN